MENRIELWVSPTGNVAVYRGNAFIPTEQLTEEERLFVLDRVCDELKGKIDLEAEIKKYTENLYNETFGNGQCTLDEFDWEDIATVIEETARHFAQWGKEQGYREGFLEGAKTQREEDDQLVDTIYQQGIEKGKDEMMEQMLKDAVEGEVYKFGEVAYVKERSNAELTKYLSQFNNGDRVKIIVIHETDIR